MQFRIPQGGDPIAAHVPLAVVTRGDTVESVHYGSIAVVDVDGRLHAWAGDPAALVFTRSSLKPLQALALVSHAGYDRLGLTDAELAVVCGSHSGEPRHVAAVLAVLAKGSASKEDLRCGVHPPLYLEALGQRSMHGDVYTPLQHNCSGKHAGMLALAGLLGAPRRGYAAYDHPVQVAVRAAIGAWLGEDAGAMPWAEDGCGVPNCALSLRSLARAYARLLHPAHAPAGSPAARIAAAMTAHPEMVAGLRRLDLALMHTGRGAWLSKSGAEGVQALALRGPGLGAAIKVADGAARAREAVAVELMRQLGALEDPGGSALAEFARPPVSNCHGRRVGEVRAVFRLERSADDVGRSP